MASSRDLRVWKLLSVMMIVDGGLHVNMHEDMDSNFGQQTPEGKELFIY